MSKISNTKRAFVILFVCFTAVSALLLFEQALVFAGVNPPTITNVTPNQTTQGEQGLVVRIDISDMPPPAPLTVTIGSVLGTNIQKDATAVTATFDFPPDMATTAYNVVVNFPPPEAPVTVPMPNGFIVDPANCFTSYGPFYSTQFASDDAQAVQDAVDAASAGSAVRIAGTCTGVGVRDGLTQTVYISKNLSLEGGYTQLDWTLEPSANAYPTYLDANGNGRVVLITSTTAMTVNVFNLNIQNGLAHGDEDGGGLYNDQSDLTLNYSNVISNEARRGGGIYNANGDVLLQTVIVTENHANGTSSDAANGGGGIYHQNGRFTILNSQILNNSAIYNGGGIVNRDQLTITTSLINGNNSGISSPRSASPQNFENAGGGIFNYGADLVVQNSTIQNNTNNGQGGGGIGHTDFGTALILQSTIMNNQANGGQGGGILFSQPISIVNSTVSGNSADVGGGVYQNDGGNTAVAWIIYSTVASNTSSLNNAHNLGLSGPASRFELTGALVAGTGDNCSIPANNLIDHGYNLDSSNSCGLTMTTSLTNTNPLLQPLAENSGDTLTHALGEGSPALDQIPQGVNGCGTTYTKDQRNEARPINEACDIGAYEQQEIFLEYHIYLPTVSKPN